MREVIFIMGDIAAGKSTYAKYLSKKYKIPYFLKDTFKELLSDSIGYADRLQNRKLSEGAFNSMLEISERLMEQDISFILESNFRQEELDAYEKLINRFKYESVILFLQGDIETLHARYIKRIDEGRHKTHLVVDLKEYEVFKKYTLETRIRKPFGKYKIIDATNFQFYNEDVLKL